MTLRLLLGAALAVAALTGCASRQPLPPRTEDSGPAAGTDEAELWYAMRRAETELRRSPQRLRDAGLEEYLRGVTCRIAPDGCEEIRLYIVDVADFNAMMAPNGMMIVWSGALLRLPDEASLAFLLGHEIGHYKARHSLQQWRRLKDTTAVLSAFQVLAYGAGAPGIAALGSLAGLATLFDFSRGQERQADVLGFEAVRAGGYDPRAGAELWARLLAEEKQRRRTRPLAIFASHPATAERLATLYSMAANGAADADNADLGRERFRSAIRPLLPRLVEAELSQRRFDASLLVITNLWQQADPVDRGLLAFALGEAYRQRDEAGDARHAADWYARAIDASAPPAAAWREHGFALAEQGQTNGAREALRHYLALQPSAPDRAFVEHEIKQLEARR